MTMEPTTKGDEKADDFASQAEEPAPSFAAEFLDFLIHNKKWWLTPIFLVLLVLLLLVYFTPTLLAPFIYL